MSTKQLREHVERGQLLAEASMYDTAFGCGSGELYDLGWDGPGAWVVGSKYPGKGGRGDIGACWGFATEKEHIDHIAQMRYLAYSNPFAKNAVENLVSYIVGTGFNYKATAKDKGSAADKLLAEEIQDAMDEAIDDWNLHAMEQEAGRRVERDGEAIIVAYEEGEELRFREPGEMQTPTKNAETEGDWYFGIDFSKEDASKILGYWIGADRYEPENVIHEKANVDSNVPRGISTLWTPRKFLDQAVKSLGAVTTTATIQSSIPWIRYHNATAGVVQTFLAGRAEATRTKASGQTVNQETFKAGTGIDANQNTKYEFPAMGVDVSKMVEAVQANLRAAASALVLPDWMLTSRLDAKYTNAEISEGPTGYMVNRKQSSLTRRFRDIMVEFKLKKAFTPEQLKRVKISVSGPGTGQGQTLEEAQVSQIQKQSGVLSGESWAERAGLDYQREQANLNKEDDRLLGGGDPVNPNDNPAGPAPVPAA